MQIRNLKLVNFRNYEKLEIEFSNKINLIYGKNGSGKTNIIEGIYVLSFTKSFRALSDKMMIKKGSESLKLEGTISDSSDNEFRIVINNEGKKVQINKNKIVKISDYISKFSAILFNPEDLRIVKDSPSVRRKSINMFLSQFDNSYLKYLSSYNKILKQRNTYLKTMYLNANASIDYLNILTDQLIDYGEKIYDYRKNYFEKIADKISKFYQKISKKNVLKIKYQSDYADLTRDEISRKYKKTENRDIYLGQTQFGIHRDDFIFFIDDNILKDYGSEGQQKNAIISLKLAELELFYETNNKYPILILDDLFSELDEEKITNILDNIDENVQTFITTTEISKIDKSKIKKYKKFHIIDGIVEEE